VVKQRFIDNCPVSAPNRYRLLAHIHITIKEPGLKEYYIDEFVFDDDPLLSDEKRQKLDNRCGSGILWLNDVGNMFKAERPIYLGRNIPNYPRPQ
jgi:protocatechuate 3,4-dioxygenase beta subunit